MSEVKYNVIYADCPWTYDNKKTGGGMTSGADDKYKTLSLEDLCALPIKKISQKDCILFMWAVVPMMPEAFKVMNSWGFCVGVGTKVLKRDLTWVNAEELVIGDRLIGFDEFPTGNRRYYNTSTVVSNGVEKLPCFDIYLENGKVLRSSSEHQWLVRTQFGGNGPMVWVKTKDLQKKIDHPSRKYPVHLPKIFNKFDFVDTYKSGFLSAAFDSEGHLRGRKPLLSFTQKDNGLYKQVLEYLKEMKYQTAYDFLRPDCHTIRINGGYPETFRFLMESRPPRLLNLFENLPIEKLSIFNTDFENIVKVVDVGMQDVATLQTDKGTYIAEGFGSHNTYKTMLTWRKIMSQGMGYWFRGQCEHLLVGTKGNPKAFRQQVCNYYESEYDLMADHVHQQKVGKHSQKPPYFRELINKAVQVSFEKPEKLELFARTREGMFGDLEYEGWSVFGNEVNNSIILPK